MQLSRTESDGMGSLSQSTGRNSFRGDMCLEALPHERYGAHVIALVFL